MIRHNHVRARTAIPRSESIVIWLRRNVPEYAEQIFERAKSYYQPALTQAR